MGVVRAGWTGLGKEMKLESCLGDGLLWRCYGRAGRLLSGEEEEGSREYYYGLARQSG